MQNLTSILLMFAFCSFMAVNQTIYAQQKLESVNSTKTDERQDWSELFPEIPECERKIHPISISLSDKTIIQTASYEKKGYPCGSISLIFQPEIKKNRAELYKIAITTRKTLIKEFDSYRISPKCGNDEWQGTIEVLFDEDKSLTVSETRGGNNILQFAETVDYKQLKDKMDRFVKNSLTKVVKSK